MPTRYGPACRFLRGHTGGTKCGGAPAPYRLRAPIPDRGARWLKSRVPAPPYSDRLFTISCRCCGAVLGVMSDQRRGPGGSGAHAAQANLPVILRPSYAMRGGLDTRHTVACYRRHGSNRAEASAKRRNLNCHKPVRSGHLWLLRELSLRARYGALDRRTIMHKSLKSTVVFAALLAPLAAYAAGGGGGGAGGAGAGAAGGAAASGGGTGIGGGTATPGTNGLSNPASGVNPATPGAQGASIQPSAPPASSVPPIPGGPAAPNTSLSNDNGSGGNSQIGAAMPNSNGSNPGSGYSADPSRVAPGVVAPGAIGPNGIEPPQQ
jgi:hypothetical protein